MSLFHIHEPAFRVTTGPRSAGKLNWETMSSCVKFMVEKEEWPRCFFKRRQNLRYG